VKSGTSGVDLSSNGSSLMSGFLSGIRAGFGPVQHFVSGIAGWIKAHKGPISYDARLLIPAGNAIMTGLNNGLTSRFSDVQKNVSAMAGQLATSINGIAGDINNSVDEDNWVKPTFYVHNELVGDKIQTIVNQGQAESSIHDRFFR
ncbi:hypothetical protein ACR934_26910, partial [Klebsiella pneumoniae]